MLHAITGTVCETLTDWAELWQRKVAREDLEDVA